MKDNIYTHTGISVNLRSNKTTLAGRAGGEGKKKKQAHLEVNNAVVKKGGLSPGRQHVSSTTLRLQKTC